MQVTNKGYYNLRKPKVRFQCFGYKQFSKCTHSVCGLLFQSGRVERSGNKRELGTKQITPCACLTHWTVGFGVLLGLFLLTCIWGSAMWILWPHPHRPSWAIKCSLEKNKCTSALADQVNLNQQRTIGEVYQQIVDITEIIENIRLLRIKVRISHTLPKYSATEVPTISICILRKLSEIVWP